MTKKIYILSFFSLLWLFGCSEKKDSLIEAYHQAPVITDSVILTQKGEILAPVKLQQRYDTFFVSYTDKPFIDVYTKQFEKIKTILLTESEPVFPTSFYVDDSAIYVTDHTKGVIVIYDRSGKIIQSFGLLPDQKERLMPFSLTYYGGVIYVGDINLKQVLAISTVNAEGITEKGELILRIPSDSVKLIEFPAMVYVTYDGRLIAGDAAQNKVSVYSCDGQYLYDFDSVANYADMTPLALAIDDKLDPRLKKKDSTSFDPSGVRDMGRIHIVDSQNGKIHLFNPVGEYLNSYPKNSRFIKPSGMVFDPRDRSYYISDPQAKKIYILSN